MLQVKEIQYKDDFYDVTIVVKQGTLSDGMRRNALQGEAIASKKGADLPENLGQLVAVHYIPSCIAATASIENRGAQSISAEPTFEEFMEYPDALVDLWVSLIWELNPHWSPFGRRLAAQDSLTENSNSGTDEETK